MTELNQRKAEPVTLGTTVLYCDGFSVQAAVDHCEEATVSGGSLITNHHRLKTRVTLMGRYFGRGTAFILTMNSMMYANSFTGINVGEIKFTGCHLQSFSAEDKGGDYISCRVTFLAEGAEQREV